jgi:glycine betaine/choline ABC-type transport system substrate-binding protein
MLIASASAAKNPLFLEIVGGLVNRISDETMRQANRIVDVNGGSISDAVNYLRSMIR